jgi:2-keto-4-pentenoate hydratase/2-oxohepta-3-ene-1,7-dioic acid hydratase in catechol pathway
MNFEGIEGGAIYALSKGLREKPGHPLIIDFRPDVSEEVLAQRDIHHGNLIHEIHKAGLFLKASSSVIGAGHAIELVHTDRRNDHEVELAVVIGKAGRGIQLQEALSHVAGYCIGLDITLRGPEERSLRKSPDTYTVLGPYLVTADELGDPGALDLSLHVGDELRQQANTRELILGVAELIVFASSFYTLHPGDVLITGTPLSTSCSVVRR